MLVKRWASLLLVLSLAVCVTGCGSDDKEAAEGGGDGSTGTAAVDSSGGGSESGSSGASAATYDTPQAAFDAFLAAIKKEDWAAMTALLVPDDQAMMAGTTIMMSGFATMGDEKKAKDLEALLKKHGIDLEDDSEPASADPREAMKIMTAPIKDKPAFVGEVFGWIAKNSDNSDFSLTGIQSLKDLKEDGDSATAKVTTEDGDKPFAFRKIDGSWRIHLPDDESEGPAPDAP